MRQFRLKQRAATPRACKGRANCKKEGRMKQIEKWETQIQRYREKKEERRWREGDGGTYSKIVTRFLK